MQVHNVRIETVSGMSTGVDLQWVKKHPLVKTVSEMSTRVDTKNIFNFFIRLKL